MAGQIELIQGGITSANGFQSAGMHIGLRRKRKDLAIVFSEKPCDWAATFTTNTVKAAPVLWNKDLLEAGAKTRAIVVNSAIANSCTGLAGQQHTKEMAETTAACLGLQPSEVLVASTGVIGVHLPIKMVTTGIKATAPFLSSTFESAGNAAEAITTTDSFVKQAAVQFKIDGKLITLGAMAKGSGMVHPNMATMLSFIATDLNIEQTLLQKALSQSVPKTYNMISVDGDSSTNDMVLLLANGLAGNKRICDEGEEFQYLVEGLDLLNTHLAKAIASDGEGASKLIEVSVSGAKSVEDARKLARHVISSNLVKISFFANDANWGRIVAAMGASGVEFDFDKIELSMSSGHSHLPLLVDGMAYWTDEKNERAVLAGTEVKILVHLGEGDSTATAWGCDLTHDYIDKSGKYRRVHSMSRAAAAEPVKGVVA
jgi:glutamate N-acetyltransferase/amino-acid N-acetyltransferase